MWFQEVTSSPFSTGLKLIAVVVLCLTEMITIINDIFWLLMRMLQLCPTLFSPMDCSPPGSTVPGILPARILQWVGIPFSRESSWPGDQTLISGVSWIVGGFFTHSATWEASPTFQVFILFKNLVLKIGRYCYILHFIH